MNPRPPAPKAGALPSCATPRGSGESRRPRMRVRRRPYVLAARDDGGRGQARRPAPLRRRPSLRPANGKHVDAGYAVRAVRGCSSMAEPQPSKLAMRVRFPSPAPRVTAGQPPVRATGEGLEDRLRGPISPLGTPVFRRVGHEWVTPPSQIQRGQELLGPPDRASWPKLGHGAPSAGQALVPPAATGLELHGQPERLQRWCSRRRFSGTSCDPSRRLSVAPAVGSPSPPRLVLAAGTPRQALGRLNGGRAPSHLGSASVHGTRRTTI